MKRVMKMIVLIASVLSASAALSAEELPGTFSVSVDAKGSISLPAESRLGWIHLGTWLVTSRVPASPGLDETTAPGPGFHDVYTQQDSLKAFRKDGRWPDGAMLVMEVRAIQWDDLPTGHVMTEGGPVKRLVMVRDAKGRFPGNPNWGDGWGWAVFTPADPKKNISSDYKKDCMVCHDSAKETGAVFTRGYPALRQ